MDPDAPGTPPDQRADRDERAAVIFAWAALGLAVLIAAAVLLAGHAHE